MLSTKTFSKYLIFLIIFVSTIALGDEPIVPDEEITSVWVKIHFFDTQAEMVARYNELYPEDAEDESLQGFSLCERILPRDFPGEEHVVKPYAECEIWQVRPKTVDDEHTVTLGHEVLHGVFGPEYHADVP